MDKYEFNIKVEQMRKLANRSDYETAMKIADTIDWKKVRNANLLSMVASIYEKNGEYQDAKDILLLAFERAPISKRLLYKLTDLALKEGNIEEADAYYREFCELAGDDSRQYLLRYKLLRSMDAPMEQQIHALERYTTEELDEKWLYELAELYQKAGDEKKCINTCDKIMLMFGLGKYVDRAMELKVQYAPLNKYQQDLAENREKYEEKLRAVEQSSEEDPMEPVDDGTFAGRVEEESEKYDAAEEEPASGERQAEDAVSQEEAMPVVSYENGYLEAAVKQAETEENLAKEVSRLGDVPAQEDSELGKTRIMNELKRAKSQAPAKQVQEAHGEKAKPVTEKAELVVEEAADAEEKSVNHSAIAKHLLIEARTPERGLDMAVRMLKQIQRETGVRNAVVKITGSRMNRRGILASIDKLSGRDLIIEEAGDLTQEMLRELERLMAQDTSGMRIVLIDNPKQVSALRTQAPSLADKFEWIVCEQQDGGETIGRVESVKTDRKVEPATKTVSPEEKSRTAAKQNGKSATAAAEPTSVASAKKNVVCEAAAAEQKTEQVDDNRPVRRVVPVKDGAMRAPDPEPAYGDQGVQEPADGEEMDIDAFAQYCCKYASEIDCSITGKSMLALYERIEILEEDGIPLTKNAAEDVIEEAADRAENPSLGKRMKSLFSPKYDKDGLLILKEEHFIS